MNSQIQSACEFVFSCQTEEGDIRGMIGNQYATYYTGAISAVLIKAGYAMDKRIQKALEWLLTMRQNDGGWSIPILTHYVSKNDMNRLTSTQTEPLKPDRTQPFSHHWTDMVLRGFAAHPQYRKTKEAHDAGVLLKSRFFQKDVYNSYKSEHYWGRFAFWWSNILTAMESLKLLEFNKDNPDIRRGIVWFIDHQQPTGLWKLSYFPDKTMKKTKKNREDQAWISLRICRLLKQLS